MKPTEPSGIRLVNTISRLSAWLGGIALMGTALMIGTDLILRKTIGLSMGGADEIAGYVLAIVSTWAFPIALLKRSHIRVDILYSRLKPKTRPWLDLLALSCMAIFVSTLLFHSWGVLWDSIQYRSVSTTPLQIPQWVPQSVWFAGYVFFALTIVVLACASLAHLRHQRWASITALIGINSVEEEIQEEIHSPAPGLTTSQSNGAH